MSCKVYCLALTAICASTVLASAQVSSSPTETQHSSTTPAAYVYVSSSPSSGKYQINGYSAASNGKLTAISGSPFSASGPYYMAVNGKWMFGAYLSNIYSLSISSTGSLKQVSEVSTNSQYAFQVASLDHTGSSLYAGFLGGSGDNGYDSYSVDNSTGALTYIGGGPGGPDTGYTPLAFIADNVYAYSSDCYLLAPDIYGAQRSSNGDLTSLSYLPSMPTGANYCPWMAAPDTTDHVAIPVWNTDDSQGPFQLAVYTAASTGDLTTTSTSSNMPSVAVGGVNDIWTSPSGKYLAVGGPTGLQLFNFNGANPITQFTDALITTAINQVFWDNSNHLYALSQTAGKLYVFTVTSTGATQAAGSPYKITGAQHLIVLPE
jgi:hypothetical protein